MNFKTLSLVAGAILVVIIFTYNYLGGFNQVEFSTETQQQYSIIGKEYIGKNNSPSLELIFEEARELAESVKINSNLVIVNDDSAYDDELNQVGYFIGVLLTENVTSTDAFPDSFILRTYKSGNTLVRARIESHNLVMPKPDRVRKNAVKYARQEGLELSNLTIEKYLDEGILEIDFLTLE